MNVYEAATTRRAIRRYKDKPVAYEILERCVDAGRLAPCGRNQQVCEYILINDVEVLPGIFENISGSVKMPFEKGGPGPGQSPGAYIIVLINKTLEGSENRRRLTHYDIGMAAENIILVALEQGLGSCPVMLFDEEAIKAILNVPDNYDVGLVIVMGYPDESPVVEVATDSVDPRIDDAGVRHLPKRKLADIVHRNRF